MIYVALWFACGVAVFAVAVWMSPDTYGADPYSDEVETFFKCAATIILWPGTLAYWAANTLRKALIRSKAEKLKVRAEVEKELASARTEVEDLLRSVRR